MSARASAALSALALLAACAGPAQGPRCASDHDCSGGKVCKVSECVAADQCASTQSSCTSNSACGASGICLSGCCEPLTAGVCRTGADCTNPAAPHCDSGACRACAANSECGNAQICTPAGACQPGCAQPSDCATGKKCFSSGAGNWCGQCAHDSDCTSSLKPVCSGGFCAGCSANSDCGGATPVCNVTAHRCVVCLESQNSGGVNSACTDATKPACLGNACVACAPSSNDGSGKNGACDPSIPYCTSADICVGCIDNTQCKTGDYCGDDKNCHSPTLTGACLGSAAVCAAGTTAFTGSVIDVAARLDVSAIVATDVSFALTSGAASFAAGSSLAATTATIAAGGKTTSGVQVHLDANDTHDVVVTASLHGVTQTATIHVTATPPALSALTGDRTAIEVDQPVTLTVSLTAAPASPIHVTLSNDNPATATLSTTDVVISGSTDGTATLTPVAGQEGPVTVHASYSGVVKDLGPIHVTNRAVAALTPGAVNVAHGGTAHLTVTLDAAPVSGAPVTVTLAETGVAGTVNGGSALTISSPNTSGTFDFVAGSSPGLATVTASAGGQTKGAAITVQPAIASVTVSPNPVINGQPATVTVTLDANAAVNTKVFLNDYNSGLGTAFKQNAYMPSFVVVAAGTKTQTATFVECKSLPNTAVDTIGIGAWIEGSNEAEIATALTVCPLNVAAGATGAVAACPVTNTAAYTGGNLCPLVPWVTDQPNNLPLAMTVAMPYTKPAAAPAGTSYTITASNEPGTSTPCAQFSQLKAAAANPLTINFTESISATPSNTRSVQNFTAIPDAAFVGACTITATLNGVSSATITTAAAALNLVAPPSNPLALPDLVLDKVEVDETGGSDVNEYVEVYNKTGADIVIKDSTKTGLPAYGLVLLACPQATIGTSTGFFDNCISGKTEYTFVDLTGAGVPDPLVIPNGGFLAIADPGSTLTATPAYPVLKLLPLKLPTTGTATKEAIGDAPSGIFLVKNGAIVDGLSFGGMIVHGTSAHVNGGAAFDWPASGDPLDFQILDLGSFPTGEAGSLVRVNYTGNNNLDWRYSISVTPGAVNTVVGP